MMTRLRQMLTCHWSARRIQRYLDADPAARLAPGEVQRLEQHLAVCGKCSVAADEYRGLGRVVLQWSQRRVPDPGVTARVRVEAQRLWAEDA
ncbi:MAG: zf-HC2 domain-containing protein [Actinomycetota bacterium]|nr:zf-HC2 domain-containing protein [Actinomycetota bacterium]